MTHAFDQLPRLTFSTVAFCFYNLSSIFNGLVYYDQFSLLPTKHLILVLVGIVVLLAGVWVVSVPANGSGLDVGTWQEEDAQLGEGAIRLDADNAVHVDADIARGRRGHGLRGYSLSNLSGSGERDPGAENHTAPEHQDIGLNDARTPEAESPPPPLPAPRTSTARHSRHISDASLTSPPRSRHTTLPFAHGAGDLSPSRPRHHLGHGIPRMGSPPLVGGASLGGFSIGLSPVSPGFAVLPRDRRRRVSGMGFGEVVDQARAAGAVAEAPDAIRRTVSESDAVRLGVEREEGVFGAESEVERGEADEERYDGGGEDTVKSGKGAGRARWGWLRRTFGRRRRDA